MPFLAILTEALPTSAGVRRLSLCEHTAAARQKPRNKVRDEDNLTTSTVVQAINCCHKCRERGCSVLRH